MTVRQGDKGSTRYEVRSTKYEVAELWREVRGSDRGMYAAMVCVGVGGGRRATAGGGMDATYEANKKYEVYEAVKRCLCGTGIHHT